MPEAEAAIQKKGSRAWLYAGKIYENGTTYERKYKYKWRKNLAERNLEHDMPQKGDILILNGGARNVYKSSVAAVETDRAKKFGVWNGGNAYVLQSYNEGRAILLQIVFK